MLNCTTSETFYFGSLATDLNRDETVDSGISVSRSTDGGQTFGPAVMAAVKDAESHFPDKPWMDAEPGPTPAPDDDILHVTYTDFSFASDACGEDDRTAIEYVRSDDGGQTWTEPLVIDEVCGFEAFVQGSQVESGPDDTVYVACEQYEDSVGTRDIRIRRSTDLEASFAAASVIDSVTPIGDGFMVQGGFRAFLDLQGLAVDGWRLDVSSAVRVNDDDPRLGIDQHFPALTVDGSSTVWTTFYDKRRDPRNLLIDSFLPGPPTAAGRGRTRGSPARALGTSSWSEASSRRPGARSCSRPRNFRLGWSWASTPTRTDPSMPTGWRRCPDRSRARDRSPWNSWAVCVSRSDRGGSPWATSAPPSTATAREAGASMSRARRRSSVAARLGFALPPCTTTPVRGERVSATTAQTVRLRR